MGVNNIEIKIGKPLKCFWISNNTWESLTLKEQDFIILVYVKKSNSGKPLLIKTIMRRLHIAAYSSYYRLQQRVTKKLAGDVKRYNERLAKKRNLQNAK